MCCSLLPLVTGPTLGRLGEGADVGECGCCGDTWVLHGTAQCFRTTRGHHAGNKRRLLSPRCGPIVAAAKAAVCFPPHRCEDLLYVFGAAAFHTCTIARRGTALGAMVQAKRQARVGVEAIHMDKESACLQRRQGVVCCCGRCTATHTARWWPQCNCALPRAPRSNQVLQ